MKRISLIALAAVGLVVFTAFDADAWELENFNLHEPGECSYTIDRESLADAAGLTAVEIDDEQSVVIWENKDGYQFLDVEIGNGISCVIGWRKLPGHMV